MKFEITGRQVIKLRHIIEGIVDKNAPNWKDKEERTKDKIYHFSGGKVPLEMLESTLSKNISRVSGPIDMSDKTLDIENVIFPPKFEEVLFKYIKDYGLHVIDTTMEKPMVKFDADLGEYVKEEPKHMSFRHEVFTDIFNSIQYRKSAIPIEKLMVEENGKLVFRYKYAVPLIIDLIQERRANNNNNLILLNIMKLNKEDLESCWELAYVVLKFNDFIEVTYDSSIIQASIYGFLPCVSQLCLDFTGESQYAFIDLKDKVEEGDRFYISTSASMYREVEVVRNVKIGKNGQNIKEIYSQLSELDQDEITNLFSMSLKFVEEEEEQGYVKISEDKDKEGKESTTEGLGNDLAPLTVGSKELEGIEEDEEDKVFDIKSKDISQLDILVFPSKVFGHEYDTLMPTESEIDYRFSNTKYKKRGEIKRNLFVEPLYRDESSITKEHDWIAEYMGFEKRMYSKMGMEIPKLDIEKIVMGEPSPFKEVFRGN